jgi:hypothetical protein
MPVPRGSLVDGNRRGATTPNRRAAGSHLQATRQRPAPWTAPLTWLSWSGCAAAAMPLSTDSRQNTWAHSSRRVSNLQRDTSRGEAGTGVHQLINQARRLRQQAQCRGMLLDQGPADMPAMQGPCFSAQRGEALRAAVPVGASWPPTSAAPWALRPGAAAAAHDALTVLRLCCSPLGSQLDSFDGRAANQAVVCHTCRQAPRCLPRCDCRGYCPAATH